MKKYLIASTFIALFMSFKQQQDSTKSKQDSIRKADLEERKRDLVKKSNQTPPQKDFSEQFKPKQNPKSNYIYKDGRIIGGSSTLKLGKN